MQRPRGKLECGGVKDWLVWPVVPCANTENSGRRADLAGMWLVGF